MVEAFLLTALTFGLFFFLILLPRMLGAVAKGAVGIPAVLAFVVGLGAAIGGWALIAYLIKGAVA